MADTAHRTPRERAAHTAAAAAIARAQAHVPDQPAPIPTDGRYPVTPDIARTIRLEIEESRNA